MAVCPKCKTELDAEFGMTQCPSCGAFSFVGDDGIARAPEDEAPPIESVARPFEPGLNGGAGASDLGFAPVAFETPEISEEPPFAFDPAPSSVVDVVADDGGDGSDFSAPSAFDTPSGFDAPPSPEAPMESFGMDSFQSVSPMDDLNLQRDDRQSELEDEREESLARATSAAELERPAMDFGPASDPLNLNEFANSEVSSGRDGPLLYRVLISGIDTKEIRESIREVLNDDRFRLDASTVLGRVSKGDLVIDGLSPVKASIFVNRIKRLPITIRWEQYAITEANP